MADNQNLDQKEQQSVSGLLPKLGHEDVGKRVFQILAEVLEDKVGQGLHRKWLEYYKLGRNVHWQRASSNVPLASVNLLHTHRQRTVNTLTDNDPSFNVMSMATEDKSEVIRNLQRSCEFWWNEQEQQALYEKSVRNGETYGITIEKSVFDPDMEFGIGEIRTVLVDPYNFGIYPVKSDAIQDAEAVLYYYPMPVRTVRRRWPSKATEIKPDSEFLDQLGSERREIQSGSASGGIMANLGSVVRALVNRAKGGKTATNPNDDDVLVVECWCKDYSGKFTGNIRCVTVCGGGQIVLEDKSNPSINPLLSPEITKDCYLYDKFPFEKANSNTDPNNFWGFGDFEQLQQIQLEFNRCISQLVFLKDKSARPKIVNPSDSGVDNSEFTNTPGIINPTSFATSQGIRYLDFPQIPQDIEKMTALLKDMFFLVAGTFELENAQTPGREVIAHRAIETLIEHASTMMRGKIRNYSKLLRERGRMYISHVQNWYTEDRWFSWEVGGKHQVGKIRAEDLQFPIRLTVLNGSTLPVSNLSKRDETIKLFELGLIDQQDALESLDRSNRDEIITRMQKGPNGELLRRMQAMGMPQEVIDTISQVATMEPDDFDKAAQQGQIPMLSPPDQTETGMDPMQQGELGALQAKIDLERANRDLIVEKANTERVMQQVHLAGVDFDKEKLRLERADTEVAAAATAADIRHQDLSHQLETVKTEDQLAGSEHDRVLSEDKHLESKVAAEHGRVMAEKTHEDGLIQAEKERKIKERGLKSNNKKR